MKRLLLILCLLGMMVPGQAQDSIELSKNPPVAIVALSQGSAQIKSPGEDWRPAYWLSLVQPEDLVRTVGGNGKVILTYFHDYHREVVESSTEAKVGFRALSRLSKEGNIRQDRPKDRGVTELPIPYLLVRPLSLKEFEGAQENGAFERENTFLSSYVKAEAFPPVFVWSDTGAGLYKLQLFNEWDEFLYETECKGTRFKYPHQANFQLAKNSLYKWQVTDNRDQIVVRKYPFVILTTLLARDLERAEKRRDTTT